MERPNPGKLPDYILNPQSAGLAEKAGIVMWDYNLGCLLTTVAVLGVGGVMAVKGLTNFWADHQSAMARPTPIVRLGEAIKYGTYPLPLESGYYLSPKLIPSAFYDGGIVVNNVDGLVIAMTPSKVEQVIRGLSWSNNPDKTKPVMTIFAPVTEAKVKEYDFSNTPAIMARYEREKRVSIYTTPVISVAVLDYLRRYIDNFNEPVYMDQLSYDLSVELLKTRLLGLKMLYRTDVQQDLSEADLQLIKRELPLRVIEIDPNIKKAVLSGQAP